MKLNFLRFALSALLVLGISAGAMAQITETFSSWTSRVSYGNYTQAGSGGTWTMTNCIIAPGGAANGTGSAGYVQMNSSADALELPVIASGGAGTVTIKFRVSATTSSPTLTLQKKVGAGAYATVNTFSTGMSTTGTTYTFDVNDASANIQLKVIAANRVFYIHDFSVATYSSSNTITTGTISPTTYCAGGSVTVPFTSSGTFTSGNVYTAQLSDASGSFSSPTDIGTLSSTGNSGNVSATLPTNATGTGYRIRVVSSAPATTGAEFATNITVNALPTISPASGAYCPGATQAITVNQPGGSWASLAGSPTGVAAITYNSPGNYTLTANAAGSADFTFNGPSCSRTVTYTVNTPPAAPGSISGPSAPCAGSTGNVYSVVAAGTYNWSVSGTGWSIPSASTTNSVTVTAGTGTGTVTIRANSGGCLSAPTTLNVTPTVPSSTSDIIVDPTYTYNNNINYLNNQATSITNTTGNIDVVRLLVRDGGASADADAAGTTLSTITFSTVGNIAFLRAAALVDDLGNYTTGTINTGAGTITFTGLNYAVSDNSSRALTLRVSFLTTVTDNQRVTFNVTNANVTEPAGCTLSQFGSFATATSSTTGNNNVVVVTADRLAFTTQPASASINTNLATFEVSAVDVNGNVDANATNSITLSTTGTGATLSNPHSLVAGTASISNVQYNAAQTGITITATTTGLAVSNTVTSSAFSITTLVFVNGDYRTTGNGAWVSNNASPAIWQRYNGSTWVTSNSPSSSTTDNMYIYHAITLSGSYSNSFKLHIMSGGSFSVNTGTSTAQSVKVYTGGTLNINSYLRIGLTAGLGTLTVEDNATVNVNYIYTDADATLWNGIESFAPNSNLNLLKWSGDDLLTTTNVSTTTIAGYVAAFGNVTINGTLNGAFGLVGPGVGTLANPVNLCHGNLEIIAADDVIRLGETGGTVYTGIGGDLLFSGTMAYTFNISTSSTKVITVRGNLVQTNTNALTLVRLSAPSGASSVTLNVEGDMTINAGNFDLCSGSNGAAVSAVNLKGNLTASAGTLINGNLSGITSLINTFNFIGTTLQDINVATTTSRVPFFIKNGASVRLVTNNLTLNNTSSLTVETGGKFDFNWTAANVPILVTQPASPTGTNVFENKQGSILYITSPDGITTASATGNVRTTNRVYDQVAYFNYVGKTNQVTGNALTGTGNGKVVIANLASNSVTLTPSNDIGISNGSTIEAQGGRLEIQKGTVIGSAAAEFKGSGRLVMTDGTYRMSETGLTLPQLTNYGVYSLTGGTVELNGTGAQDLSASPSSYYNVKFSGTNAGGTDVVTTNGGLVIDNNLNITNSAIFDSENHGVTGTAGVTMNSGRWRIGKVSATLPELTAIAVGQSYSLTGGTIEYYNAGANQIQTIRDEDGNSNMITYYNVEVKAAAVNTTGGNLKLNTNKNVGISNSFTLYAGASALLNMNSAVVGTGTFTVQPDATLLYGHADGITTSGAVGNVRVTGTRTFPTTASYGFTGGASTMVSGNGLPATVKNLYLNKTSGTSTVTLTNSVGLTGDLNLATGLLVLGTHDITLSNTSTVTGTPSATAMVVTNATGKFIKGFAAGTSLPGFTYPVGDNTGTNEYSPATLTLATNANAGAVGVIVTDAVHPNMGASADYTSRYWTLSNTGLTNYTYTASYTYAAADKVGTETLYKASRWNGSAWLAIAGSAAALNTVTIATPQTQTTSPLTGDYTARLASPVSVYTWTGNVSTAWDEPLNWNVGMVPDDCTHNVLIPATPGTPTPSGNFPAIDVLVSVGNIQVGDNSRITLDANLNVCGNWTGAPATAAVMLGNGSVVLQGSTTQTLSGKTQFNTLRVNNNAQIQSGSALEVFTALELQSGTFAAGNNLLTFRSTSTTEVAILNNFGSGFAGTITGSIKAERYYANPVSQSFGQHMMGSPVDAPAFSQFGATGNPGQIQPMNCWIDSFMAGSPYGSMYEYIEANGATCGMKVWTAVTNGNTVNGKGYSVYRQGTGTLTVNGAPNLDASYGVGGLGRGTYSNSASYIQTPPLTSVTINAGWHLVANPYLATLNVATHAQNSSNFQAQVQVWQTTGPFAGTYRTYTTGSNAVIAPFQAFLVRRNAVGAGQTYNLYASDRTTTATTFQRQASQSELKVTALNTTTGLLDETVVAFNTDATAQFDNDYDGNKMQGSNTRHSLYTVLGSEDYSINTLNDVTQTSTVPMHMRPGVDATFKFTVDGINTFDATQYIYLEDKITGQMIDLRQNPEYTFSMTTAEAFDRFVLHFTPAAAFAATDASCDAQGQINITQPGTANWNYTVVDANNATVSSGTLNQANPVTVNAATGIYTVTLIDANNYTVARNVQINGANAADATFTPSATTVEEGADVVLQANQNGNNTYTWDLGNGTTATGSGVTFAYNTPGVYTVELTVTNAGGCTATSTQIITVNEKVETGIKDVTDTNIKLWSNKNKVYVDFGKTKLDNATVAIYNLIGQELSKEKFNGTIYVKEVTQLEAGYVLVRVESNGNITTKKLLITNK